MVRLIIHGANGNMGKTLTALALRKKDAFSVVAGIDKFPPRFSEYDFPYYTSLDDCREDADLIIDFSLPEATRGLLTYALSRKLPLVIATTGLSNDEYALIREAGKQIPVFISPNMSLGVNLQIELIKRTAAFLGEAFDIEIIEKHHNQKVDAPSGTAVALANALTEEFPDGKDLIYERQSKRMRRTKREIGMHSIRGGTIVGEHQVLFIGEDEVLEINHIAQSRRIFAAGALRAAEYIVSRPAKVYCMEDIVAEHNTVTNISREGNQSIISIERVPNEASAVADIFTAIAVADVNVDMISQTSPVNGLVGVSFTLGSEQLPAALSALKKLQHELPDSLVSSISGIAKLSIEGIGMEHRPGIAAQMFRVLAGIGVTIKLVTTSETKTSCCIDTANLSLAVDAIQKAFNLSSI